MSYDVKYIGMDVKCFAGPSRTLPTTGAKQRSTCASKTSSRPDMSSDVDGTRKSVGNYLADGRCIMKERPASEGRDCDEAPPPLRCAVQGFAPLRRRSG